MVDHPWVSCRLRENDPVYGTLENSEPHFAALRFRSDWTNWTYPQLYQQDSNDNDLIVSHLAGYTTFYYRQNFQESEDLGGKLPGHTTAMRDKRSP